MRPKAPNPLTDNGLRANCGCRVLIRDRTGWDFLVEFGLSQTEVGTEVVLLVKVNGDHVPRPIGRGHSSVVHGHSSVVDGHLSVVDGHLSVATDIRLLSTDICLLSTDICLLSTDKWLMSTDRSLESVAASPLSADQGAGFTLSPFAARPHRR